MSWWGSTTVRSSSFLTNAVSGFNSQASSSSRALALARHFFHDFGASRRTYEIVIFIDKLLSIINLVKFTEILIKCDLSNIGCVYLILILIKKHGTALNKPHFKIEWLKKMTYINISGDRDSNAVPDFQVNLPRKWFLLFPLFVEKSRLSFGNKRLC